MIQTISFISIHAMRKEKKKRRGSYFSGAFSGTSSGDLENLSIKVFHKPFFSSSICCTFPDKSTLHSSTVTPVKLVSLTRGNLCRYMLPLMRAKLSYIWSHFSGSEICVFSPSRKADATLCRRNVPKSRLFLASSRGHSSHSFKNRRYLVADIFGHVKVIAFGEDDWSLSFTACCTCVTSKPFLLLSAPLVAAVPLATSRVSKMSGSEGKKGSSSGVMEWIGSACRFATDRNDFRRNLLVNLGLFAAGVWVARNLSDFDLMSPQPVT